MSIQASQLVGLVSISGADEGVAKLLRVGAVTDSVGGKLGLLAAGALVVAGAALVGFGLKAASMASDFQQQMTTLVTGAGESRSAIDMVGQGILNMAVDTATPVKQLTDGMFMIESAGFHGASGLKVLQTAAEGAKVGNADLGTVADALTTVMKDYGLGANRAGDAMNFLTAIVRNGKTHLQDLAHSMSSILPIAGNLHIPLVDVGAAMATMTGEGVPAANAATYLRQTLSALSAPAAAGKKALESIGLTTQQVSDGMKKSLPDTLQMIMNHLAETYKVGSPQYNEALKAISGGSKTLQGMLDLTGIHMKDFQQNVKNVADVMNKGKGSVTGWSDVTKDFGFKLDKAKEVAETFGIKVGTALLPILGKLVDFFTNNVVPALQKFGGWIQQNVLPILQAFGKWIQQQVLPILQAFGKWFQNDAVPALQKFGDIIKTQVFPVVQNIATIIGTVLQWVKDHWTQIWNVLGPILKAAWDIISGIIKTAWALISGIIKIAMDVLKGNWSGVWNDIKKLLGGVLDGIGTMVRGFINLIGGLWNAFGTNLNNIWHGIGTILQNTFGNMFSWLGTHVHDAVNGVISWFQKLPGALLQAGKDMIQGLINGITSMAGNLASAIGTTVHNAVGNIPGLGGLLQSTHLFGYQAGGPVLQTGLALLHKGEYVLPAGGFVPPDFGRSYGSGGGYSGQPVVVQFKINGYQFISAVMPDFVRAVRNSTGVINF